MRGRRKTGLDVMFEGFARENRVALCYHGRMLCVVWPRRIGNEDPVLFLSHLPRFRDGAIVVPCNQDRKIGSNGAGSDFGHSPVDEDR